MTWNENCPYNPVKLENQVERLLKAREFETEDRDIEAIIHASSKIFHQKYAKEIEIRKEHMARNAGIKGTQSRNLILTKKWGRTGCREKRRKDGLEKAESECAA